MNCVKSINIHRDYGLQRIFLISILIGICYFIVFYVSFNLLFPEVHFKEINLPIFIINLFLVYPIHKLFHCLPIWLSGKKAKITIHFGENSFPILFCKFTSAIPRNLSLITIGAPTVIVTIICIVCCILLPEYIYLFALFSSVNISLSIIDIIYFKHVWKAPKSAYLEDNPTVFNILTNRKY